MHRAVRLPVVAGSFYPADPAELRSRTQELLGAVVVDAQTACPKAVIVPHAGLSYSGPIAAFAYARLAKFGEQIRRVVLIGPAHRWPLEGLVGPGVARMRTPLGDVAVDATMLLSMADVGVNEAAHARERSLEVQLPFLQLVAPRAKVVPIAVGRAAPDHVARVLAACWGGPETVVVVSSDLSHALSYDEARVCDEASAAHIVALESRPLPPEQACGAAAINGLLTLASRKPMRCELLDLRSSGDTVGARNEVVGYGAFALTEA